tara:strand:+ start:104 stop:1687 length:1584 start_codon:yes stop_codon:yes gene_type:complete
MTLICKTGCGQQIVYDVLEFTDGFEYSVAREEDGTLHKCPILFDQKNSFTEPGQGYVFDTCPIRENSYGDELMKARAKFLGMDDFLIQKRDELTRKDVEMIKIKIQSILNSLPNPWLIVDNSGGFRFKNDSEGVYRDTVSPANIPPNDTELVEYYVQYEKLKNITIENQITSKANSKNEEFNNEQYDVHSTLSVAPLEALMQVYCILEGHSENVKKCQLLLKETYEDEPYGIFGFWQNNPFHYGIINLAVEIKRLKQRSLVATGEELKKIKYWLEYYEILINGTNGITKWIKRWYRMKEIHMKDIENQEKYQLEAKEKNLDSIKGDKLKESYKRIFDLREIVLENEQSSTAKLESEKMKFIASLIDPIQNLDSEEIQMRKHLAQHSQIHISNTEKILRRFIIDLYDNDIFFLKKHFKQIWNDMEITAERNRKKISQIKVETELDNADLGHLIMMLENKESKKRAKEKKAEAFEDLITKIAIVNEKRNRVDHSRGVSEGELPINEKMVLVGHCSEIDQFCDECTLKWV